MGVWWESASADTSSSMSSSSSESDTENDPIVENDPKLADVESKDKDDWLSDQMNFVKNLREKRGKYMEVLLKQMEKEKMKKPSEAEGNLLHISFFHWP